MSNTRSRRRISSLPSISNERLKQLRDKIKPVETRDGKVWFIDNEKYHPRTQSYNWNKKVTSEALGIEPMEEVRTLHDFGAPVFFKPSEAEVLACLDALFTPQELEGIVAYEVDYNGLVDVSGSHHVAYTMIYKHKEK